MLHNTSGYVLLAAMASASSYAAPHAVDGPGPQAALAQMGQDMRHAQVELYCDHAASAIAAIRRATLALEATPGPVDPLALAALEQAIWEARRDHTEQAVAALDTALLRLHA